MLAIRLQRVGRKNDPSFRIIVTDSKLKPKTGNFLEILGSYDARKGKPIVDVARAKHWLSMGAQASGTVHNILVDLKAVSAKKINVLGKKTPIVKEAPKVEEKAEVKAEAPKAEEKAEEKIVEASKEEAVLEAKEV
ncbi:MAG: 30S ribosomal protein S16 [Patescibacteria group bacterium]